MAYNNRGGRREKTLTFLATMFRPRTKCDILATAVLDVERFTEAAKAAIADCKKRGSKKIQVKLMKATKGQGDFWLATEVPPLRGGKPKGREPDPFEDDFGSEDDSSDEDDGFGGDDGRPDRGSGW